MLTNKQIYDKLIASVDFAEMIHSYSQEDIVAHLHQIAKDVGRTDLTPETITAQLGGELSAILAAGTEDDSLTDEELELVSAAGSVMCDNT